MDLLRPKGLFAAKVAIIIKPKSATIVFSLSLLSFFFVTVILELRSRA